MIPWPELCIKSVSWGFLYCIMLSMTACSDDEPAETVEVEPVAEEAPLPVRQWYPRQKQSAVQPQYRQPQHQISQPQFNQQQATQSPPAFNSQQPAQQQTWSGGYQVYQAPPLIIVQPQSSWYGTGAAGQQPAQQTATPQQYVNPYSYQQVPQRPWGEAPQTRQNAQQTYTAPPAGVQQVNPWSGWQAPVAPAYPAWGTPYGGYPGTAPPGYAW